MKNIIYIASRGDQGAGGENYLLKLFRQLDYNRFTPFIVLPKEGTLRKPLEKLGLEVFVVDANYGWLKPDLLWYEVIEGMQFRVKKLVELIAEKNIDLVHTNSNLRFEGALAARLAGIPHLYLAHIEYQPNMPLFQRFPLSQPSFAQMMNDLSDYVVAVSGSVAKTLEHQIPEKKLEVIHNGIELDRFDQIITDQNNNIRKELQLPDDCLLITGVGRITPDKGFDYFVEMARLVLEVHPANAHFLIVGGSENSEFTDLLKKKVEQYNLDDRLHFLGFRQDIPEILTASDIFVLTSRKEGHPYVMLEAMASRCSVVAFNCAGVEETIGEGLSGFIVPIGDVTTLADRISALVDSEELRSSLAQAARKQIENHFTAQQTADKLMTVYDKMMLTANKPGAFGIELFLQNCTEVARLGKKNIELENRLRRIEHIADLIENNFLAKTLKKFRRRIK